MYKVLIVDDEVLVRIGIKNTIDWESLGFEVVGEASNGEAALAQFELLSPDVVITDIKMPKQDGLWLTEQIHNRNKQVKILVLTCYDEFHYARTALKNGAFDYILKSEIVDEELIELMAKIKEQLDEEISVSMPVQSTQANTKAMKRSLLNDLIRSQFLMDEKLTERLHEQEVKTSDTRFGFLYFKMMLTEHHSAKQISETTINLVVDLLNQRNMTYLYNGYTEEHLFFIENPQLTLLHLSRLASAIENAVEQYFGIKTHIMYSNAISEIDLLGEEYAMLMEALQKLYFIPKTESYVENDAHIKWEKVRIQPLKKYYGPKLTEAVGKEGGDQALELVEEIWQLFLSNHYKPKYLRLLLVQLVGEIYSVFQYVFENAESPFSLSDYQDTLLSTQHIDDLKARTEQLIKLTIDELKYIRANQSNYLIKRAINFVEHNYDQNISLEDVAKVINLSKQYVCHIFKKETGKNLSTFINEVRIEKAKQLLLNPAYSNKEIYEMVGFSNQQYFSRVFKKMTHMTTSEYKEKYL